MIRLLEQASRQLTPEEEADLAAASILTNPYPYLIDYRVTANDIIIMRFRHAARRLLDP